ncbi:hypothetical protein ACFL6U_20900 [Planctomycetota bacterium]
MDEPNTTTSPSFPVIHRYPHAHLLWGSILLVWLVALCLVPDPRPLGAREWAVRGIRAVTHVSEPTARVMATVALRGIGLGCIGILLALSLQRVRLKWAALLTLIAAPLLAVVTQWINYGYFPIAFQLQFGVVSAIAGALLGMALRRSRMALVALAILVLGLFAWGTATGVPDDLYEAARATGLHVLEHAEEIPPGDEGFGQLLYVAFTFAEDNSHRTDAVFPNRAAILALSVILGEERVAQVAKRPINLQRQEEITDLRRRVTLRGRHDLSQHFWVSAALAVLSDESRSMTVGITKELQDATPGGSGFSFVDLTADRAGILFANAATRNAPSARAMQLRIRDGARIADFCPDIQGLPEGLSRDTFQAEYGGLGGAGTQRVVTDIRRRLATCAGLQ